MNFRKQLRSIHNQSAHSIKKIQINPFDLQDCNQYSEAAQSTKQSESSILSKMLLQPPSMKAQQANKLVLESTSKKYHQKFTKPDVENLIQQNINLKNMIQASYQSMNLLKIKHIELEKKINLLERGLDKVQKDENLSRQSTQMTKENCKSKVIFAESKKKTAILQLYPAKKTMVHTEILKKKIGDLTAQNISIQNELKFLKKLPNITIYEQNEIEKQHLIAQTIRLKSIIVSLSQEPIKEDKQRFEKQFMRLMKEQNQKLKATIRLLENDKILLKSRQTIQNKVNSELKKEKQQLRSSLMYKQSQVEKINNENKNLLFKKTMQFRQEEKRKENEVIEKMRTQLDECQKERLRMQQNNQMYCEQNARLKEKEKNLTQLIVQMQSKYDQTFKQLNQEIEQLQFELNNAKTNYFNLLNSSSLNKNKSLKRVSYTPLNQNSQLLHKHLNTTTSKLNPDHFPQTKVYARPVQWADVFLAMANFFNTLKQDCCLNVDIFIKNVEENGTVRCGDLVQMFVDEPFNMAQREALKLGRYICEDSSSHPNTKVVENLNLAIESFLARTILVSSLQKIKNKLGPQFILSWQNILAKTKKLQYEIVSFIKNKPHVTKQELIELINKNSRLKVQSQQYQFMCLKCMDKQKSEKQFVLNVEKIHSWLNQVKAYSKTQNQNYFDFKTV